MQTSSTQRWTRFWPKMPPKRSPGKSASPRFTKAYTRRDKGSAWRAPHALKEFNGGEVSMSRLISFLALFIVFSFVLPSQNSAQELSPFGCPEVPREDSLPSACVPPTSELEAATLPPIPITLNVPEGTPLRISLDQRVPIGHVGEVIHGKVVEPVYAFDQMVIPVGSKVSGRVIRVDPVPVKVRALSYSNGNFTPFHKYQVTFDQLTLPDGKVLNIRTITSPGIGEIVHLVANKSKEAEEKKRSAAARAAGDLKQEASTQIHSDIAQIKSPNLV